MISTAKAFLDPKLGNSMWIAWGAMWSPEAKAAGIKKACIEIGSSLIGKGAEGYAERYLAEREPLFKDALESIRFAEKGRKAAADPAMKKASEEVIKEAGGVMDRAYRSYAKGTGDAISTTTGVVYENVLEAIDGTEKRNR